MFSLDKYLLVNNFLFVIYNLEIVIENNLISFGKDLLDLENKI